MRKLLWLVAVLALAIAVVSVPARAEEIEPEVYTCGDFMYVILEDGTAEIAKYTGEVKELEIPTELNGLVVSSIGKKAFYSCQLNSVIIPEGVIRINDNAFRMSFSLKSVSLPDTIIEIEQNPFSGCIMLEEISISADHPYLALIKGVLYSKPDKRLILCPPAFPRKDYSIPDGILEIEDYAFSGCFDLTSVMIPDSVTSIGAYAFEGCSSLPSITIPGSVKSIGKCAFTRCRLLSSVTIQEGVESIEDYAFSSCDALMSISIPDSVSHVGSNPVSNFSHLLDITISPEHPYLEIIDGVVFNKEEKRLICCTNTFNISDYIVPDGSLEIGNSAFENCDSILFVTIPESVQMIGEVSFYDCKSATIIVPRDSYAEEYCKEKGIKYTYLESLDWLNN